MIVQGGVSGGAGGGTGTGDVTQATTGTQVQFQIPWWTGSNKELSRGVAGFTFNSGTSILTTPNLIVTALAGGGNQIAIANNSGAVAGLHFTAKGQLVSFDGTVITTTNVGTNGQVLTADSTAVSGIAWATPTIGTGDVTQQSTGTQNSGQITWWTGTAKELSKGIAGFNINTGTSQITVPNLIISGLAGANDGLVGVDGAGVVDALSFTTKGQIVVFNGTDLVTLDAGTNGQVLSANAVAASGLQWITGGGGGGANAFIQLIDCPSSYSGAAFEFPTVNSAETGLIFTDIFSVTPIEVSAVTVIALPANIYANGASGVGATLTGSVNGAFPTVNTIAPVLNLRYLIKNEVTQSHNGVYQLSTLGDGSNPYVLTRTTDSDQSAELQPQTVFNGATTGVNARRYFTQQTTAPVVGTSALIYIRGGIGGNGFGNPMTTTGDMIYSSDNLGTPTRIGIGSTNQVLTVIAGLPSWQPASSGTALSALTAGVGTNTIDSTLFKQEWQWSTLAGTDAFKFSSTSTAAASNAQVLLNLALSGTNGTSAQTTYGLKVSNAHAGTTSSNVSGYFASINGTTGNYAIVVPASSGFVGFGTVTPTALLHLKTAAHAGSTSAVLFETDAATPIFQIRDDGAFALGDSASLTNALVNDVIIGFQASVGASGSDGRTAIGYLSTINGTNSVAMGARCTASNSSVAIGQYATASGLYGVAIGSYQVVASGTGSVIIGASTFGTVTNSINDSFMLSLVGSGNVKTFQQSFFVNYNGNLVSNALNALTTGTDYDAVASNVHTIHNGHQSPVITVSSVVSNSGALFTFSVANNDIVAGDKVVTSGFSVYNNQTYYCSGNGSGTRLYATRANALSGTSAVAFISTDTGTITPQPRNTEAAIADSIQIYAADTSDATSSLALFTEQAVVSETVISDRTLKVTINGTSYKICLKV